MAVFKSPVGSPAARNTGKIWPAPWQDKNWYGREYTLNGRTALHTGADLNLPNGDDGEEVFSMGPGIVTFADEIGGSNTWGNVIIIYHGTVDGEPLFSRYAHLQAIEPGIKKDVEVDAENVIGYVGSGPAGSGMEAHLHFDISTTRVLLGKPGDWPGSNRIRLEADYVPPKQWLEGPHVINKDAKGKPVSDTTSAAPASGNRTLRTPGAAPAAFNVEWYVIARPTTEVRADLSKPAGNTIKHGVHFPVKSNPETCLHDEFFWVQVSDGALKGLWVKYSNKDQSEFYLSSTPPSP